MHTFCSRYPAFKKCRGREWETLPPITTLEDIIMARFPPIPVMPQIDVLVGVPQNLIDGTPSIAFQRLEVQDRTKLIRKCMNQLQCLKQEDKATNKREQIAKLEIALANKLSKASVGNVEDDIEQKLMRTQQVKNSLFQFAGIAEQVVPTDDGTFQNDILLTIQQSNYFISALGDLRTRKKRQSLFLDKLPNEKWDTKSPIKYAFDSSLEKFERELVIQALNQISSQTCIKFAFSNEQPKEPHLFYVKVAESDTCGISYIGRVENVNPIYLSFACEEKVGIAIHETLHALGLGHQQLRVDRDEYVDVIWENINPKLYDYFALADSRKFTSYGVTYDYYSIMHYGPYIGGINSTTPTIVPKYQSERFLKVMGQRKSLSDKDVELLTAMYCSEECRDNNVYCGLWALKRLCNLPSQFIWMNNNCRKSCGLC
ncbi:unnamed protein product [Thelazia callipaeda]|uniref:Metalloendopeptidase n=1 Tax=Thelazia callipaeda TaxID=103827 RepID=A0A0N5D7F2_THECL|nr:unnamed protein product [Thelazia callipaeda]